MRIPPPTSAKPPVIVVPEIMTCVPSTTKTESMPDPSTTVDAAPAPSIVMSLSIATFSMNRPGPTRTETLLTKVGYSDRGQLGLARFLTASKVDDLHQAFRESIRKGSMTVVLVGKTEGVDVSALGKLGRVRKHGGRK